MAAQPDPYRDWLRITEPQRPVGYYQLLGIERSETGEAIIAASADERIAKVSEQLKGPHARLARRTLFELEAAKKCLLDPAARGNYDESLKSGAITADAIEVGYRPNSTPASDAAPPELRGALSDLLDEALPAQPAPEAPRDLSALQLPVARKSRHSKSRETLTAVLMIVIPAIVLICLGALAVSFIESRLSGSGDEAPPVAAANQGTEPPDPIIRREVQRQRPLPGQSSSSLPAVASTGVNARGSSTIASGRAQKNLTPSTNPVDTDAAPHRLPAPSPDSLADAGRRAHEGVAKQIEQAETPERKTKLAQSLLDSPPAPAKAQADRFAQLDLARGLALEAQDARLFGQIVDQMAVEFEVDGMALKVAGLCTLFERELPREPRLNLVKTSVVFINRLADAERFDEAVKLAKLSFAAARELSEERIVTYLSVRGKELVASQTRFVAAKAALVVLRERPADSTANEQAGLWFWLDKLDRDRGFTYLAKAEDEQLRGAVSAALALPPAPDAQLKLADVWWDLGKGLAPGAKRAAILREALQWYRRALVHLPAANSVAYKRVVELEREVGMRTVPALVINLDQETIKLPLDQDDAGDTIVELEILKTDGFTPAPHLPTGAQKLSFSVPLRLVLHETDPRIEIHFLLKSVNGQRLLAVSPIFAETTGTTIPFTNQRVGALGARLPDQVTDLRARIAGLDNQIQDLKLAGTNLVKYSPATAAEDAQKTIRLQQMQKELNRLIAQEASLVKSLGPLERRLAMLPSLAELRRRIHDRVAVSFQVSSLAKNRNRTVLLETD